MTEYNSKRRNTKRKVVIASSVAAGLLIPTAAWAAVSLFGFGDFAVAASTPAALQVIGTPTLSKTLAPGQTVGVTGNVKNPNDYDIQVTDVIVKKIGLSLTGGTALECKVSFGPTGVSADFPAEGSAAAITNGGVKFHLASPVTVAAGATTAVSVPGVIKQDVSATKLCGVGAHYAVVGQVGS